MALFGEGSEGLWFAQGFFVVLTSAPFLPPLILAPLLLCPFLAFCCKELRCESRLLFRIKCSSLANLRSPPGANYFWLTRH